MNETDALETMTRLRDASSIGMYVAIEVGLLYSSYLCKIPSKNYTRSMATNLSAMVGSSTTLQKSLNGKDSARSHGRGDSRLSMLTMRYVIDVHLPSSFHRRTRPS